MKINTKYISNRIKKELYTMIKYGFVGIINTLVFSFVTYLISLTNIHYSIYTAIGYAAGILCSYILNLKFTFSNSAKRKKTFFLFIIVALTLLGIAQIVQYITIDLLSMKPFFGIATGMVFYTLLGYILNRNVVFKYILKN